MLSSSSKEIQVPFIKSHPAEEDISCCSKQDDSRQSATWSWNRGWLHPDVVGVDWSGWTIPHQRWGNATLLFISYRCCTSI